MSKCKGLIFDLDGVLVFTDRYHYLAWKGIADSLHIPFDESINNRLRGVSRMESLDIILENYHGKPLSAAEKEALAARKNDAYRTFLAEMTAADVSTEVRHTLAILRQRGYALAIGSSSKNAGFILDQTALRDAFDAVSDGNNIARSKPDPEVFLKAAAFLSLPPAACAVVEDAYAGIAAAKAGGMTAIAIGDAVSSPETDIRLTRFSDLLTHFQ